ncbi:MAG: metallophosphoesterase [Boseongicola sp.]|nr:metallophosphoesterase [Boseongicola sp.]
MNPFTIAILTDTHIRAPGGDQSSPYPVNTRANARARYAVEVIRAEERAFAVHLGDIVHPLPHMATYADAADEAHRILSPLAPKLHLVPGNHDIGDKSHDASPAGPVNETSRATYRDAFGRDYWLVEHDGVAIFAMNSSLVNAGTDAEAVQRDWLERELMSRREQRVFLFSHYPPFIASADEAEHYDNYAEPGRSWLLDLAADTGVEAIFSGHVHHFFFNRYRGVKLYCLPATSFTRQDYAEIFSASPASEFGRDDRGKFAVSFLDLSDDGHRLRVVGTGGNEWNVEGAADLPDTRSGTSTLIPHLRHDWATPRVLPYNGPMEEFSRKAARNDYPLLRLLQLGISTIRVPASDFLDPIQAARLDDWISLRGQLVVFSTESPTGNLIHAVVAREHAVVAWEIVTRNLDDASSFSAVDGMTRWLGKISTSADNVDRKGAFAHSVTSGFLAREIDKAVACATSNALQGVVLQLGYDDDLAVLDHSADRALGKGLDLVVNVRLSHDDPSQGNFDAQRIADRINTCQEWADEDARFHLQLDTFEDVDRGYSPRLGLVDRLGNPRFVWERQRGSSFAGLVKATDHRAQSPVGATALP